MRVLLSLVFTVSALLSINGMGRFAVAQTGGCCLDGGVCISVSPATCASASPPGAYQGDSIACPGLCAQQGACCFPDGSCEEVHYGPCDVGAGSFQGNGTACTASLCPVPAPVPTQINHQGVVSVNGRRFNGEGDFYFAIVDPATGNSVWTSDGTNIGTANRPNRPARIDCVQGLYSVQLGDTLIPYMKPIPVSVFSSPNRTLRIWFEDGINGVFQLTPDHALTSVPYTMRAPNATKTSIFTASGTWNKPIGLKYIEIEVVGGGCGGQGAASGGAGAAVNGGGSGGYARKTINANNLNETEVVTVGSGGAGGGSGGTPTNGTPGNPTSFGKHVSCSGGSPTLGGNAVGGDINIPGQAGTGGISVDAQNIGLSGTGGSNPLGIGGAGQLGPGATVGNSGTGYGAGGGGSIGGSAGPGFGGAGASGVVIVKEYF